MIDTEDVYYGKRDEMSVFAGAIIAPYIKVISWSKNW